MAVEVEIKRRIDMGNANAAVIEVTFDDSYPTGGEALSAKQMGLEVVDIVHPVVAGGYVFQYDHANEKLVAYYADYDAVADGALIEVADTTDLSAVSVRLLAVGL